MLRYVSAYCPQGIIEALTLSLSGESIYKRSETMITRSRQNIMPSVGPEVIPEGEQHQGFPQKHLPRAVQIDGVYGEDSAGNSQSVPQNDRTLIPCLIAGKLKLHPILSREKMHLRGLHP